MGCGFSVRCFWAAVGFTVGLGDLGFDASASIAFGPAAFGFTAFRPRGFGPLGVAPSGACAPVVVVDEFAFLKSAENCATTIVCRFFKSRMSLATATNSSM